MFVRPRIWDDRASKLWDCLGGDCELVPFESGGSGSFGICMFCKASIVAEGGVFSPNNGFERYRLDMRTLLGESCLLSRPLGVGVLSRGGVSSLDRLSLERLSGSIASGRPILSGERFSRNPGKSLGLRLGVDCRRLWYWPLIRDFSGDPFNGMGFTVYELDELSRLFSASAAAVAWMFADTFGRVAGLPGFNGRGGGARSGSELSHLLFERFKLDLCWIRKI